MTEPESDEFYAELRRKLIDYGSHPSEEVWAGIRQQLPKPAPVPALRSRSTRRRVAVLGAALLLLASGVVLSLYYHSRRASLPTTDASLVMGSARPSARPLPQSPVSSTTPSASASTATLPSANAPASRSVASTTSPAPDATATDAKVAARLSAAHAASTARSTARSASTVALTTARRKRYREHTTSEVQRAKRARMAMVALRTSAATLTQSINARSPDTSRTRNQQSTRSSLINSNLPEPIKTGGSESSTTTKVGVAASPDTPGLLSSLPIALALPSLGTPSVTPVAEPKTQQPVLPTATRRLAVQVLDGPALSYRHLGSTEHDSVADEVARLERPAAGYSVQFGLTYALTPRLRLGTGLGYSEYAALLNLRVKQIPVVYASFSRPVLQYNNGNFSTLYVPDSIASRGAEQVQRVHHRDTYRFLTVPVQVQYQLGARGRLTYGLLLGSTVNLYLGGRTTDPNGCGCEQNTWHRSGSPFRVTSLGLMAGTALDYRLFGRWSLALQPTFHYLSTPLSKNQAAPARHLLSGSLRTGLTFDLR